MQWRTLVALAAVVLACGPTPAAHAGPAGSPEADAAFVAAAKAGDSRTVRTLVRQRVDVNAPEADGTSPLHWAVWSEDVETVTVLLRAGAKVRAANRYGVTPLTVAATNGNAPIIELLLKAGADANTATPEGETALMTAARSGSVAAVRTLLAHGANVNAKERWDDQTALMWAAAENHGDVVGLLVEAGADVNARARVIPGMPERPQGWRGRTAGRALELSQGRPDSAALCGQAERRLVGPGARQGGRGSRIRPIPTASPRSSWRRSTATTTWPACSSNWAPA